MAVRRALLICLFLMTLLLFTGCGHDDKNSVSEIRKYGLEAPHRVGVVVGEKKSKEVSDGIVPAIKEAAAKLDAECKILMPGDLFSNEESLKYLSENEFDLIFAVGQEMEKDIDRVAKEYPDIKYVFFDSALKRPNVACVKYKINEGAFMAGVTAALLTKTQMVGVAAVSPETGREILNGFVKGVNYVNTADKKSIKVSVIYTGTIVTKEGQEDRKEIKNPVSPLYWYGCDVVFAAGENLDELTAEAAKENKKIALIKNMQLMDMYPWNIYGVVSTRDDVVVYNLVKNALSGKFAGGILNSGLSDGSVDLLLGKTVPKDIDADIKSVRELIKRGTVDPGSLKVPSDIITDITGLVTQINAPVPRTQAPRSLVRQTPASLDGNQAEGADNLPPQDGGDTAPSGDSNSENIDENTSMGY